MKKLISLLFVCLALIGLSQTQTATATPTQEKLNILWPAIGDWKVANAQQTDKILLEEFVHAKENINNWNELGTNIVQKGVKGSDLATVARKLFEQAQKNNSAVAFSPVDDDIKGELPWILFKIEAAADGKDKKPQSQLFYVVQGKMNLYISFFAVKKEKLSKAQMDKYSKFFRSCIMQYK